MTSNERAGTRILGGLRSADGKGVVRMEELARDVEELRRRQDVIDREGRGAKRQDQQGDAHRGSSQRRGQARAERSDLNAKG